MFPFNKKSKPVVKSGRFESLAECLEYMSKNVIYKGVEEPDFEGKLTAILEENIIVIRDHKNHFNYRECFYWQAEPQKQQL